MSNRFSLLAKNKEKHNDKPVDKTDKKHDGGGWKLVDKKQFVIPKPQDGNLFTDKKKVKQNKPDICENTYDKYDNKYENKNVNKILCLNMITHGTCGYGNKCLYAHDLSEQNMDAVRKKAYDIVLGNNDLSHIDLQKDLGLYKALLELTTICEQCDENKCIGGYNCKKGACSKKYHICIKDLNYGNCVGNCGCVHLSNRGLKHFITTFVKPSVNHTVNNAPNQVNTSISDSTQNMNGTLLSSDFFKNLNVNDNTNDECDMLSDISDDSNSENLSDECNQSIFDKVK